MKTIVCYGDSNTWGYDPATKDRFDERTRWTGVLARELGEGYRVVEEGLNGRTTIIDDPIGPYLNGLPYLMPCLDSQDPFDVVIIMLGTNDLKARFNRRPSDIAESAGLLARMAKNTPFGPGQRNPRVLLVCPAAVTTPTDFAAMFEGAREKSLEMPRYYEMVAGWQGVDYLDANQFIACSDLDGIHFEAGEHEKLGRAMAAKIREMIG